MANVSPLVLCNDNKKSRVYFRARRWEGKRQCPRCDFQRKIYHLDNEKYRCKRCQYTFSEFTGTYLERIRISFSELAHLLYLFALGVPAWRGRQYLSVNINTAQRYYRLFRQAIYDHCMETLKETALSGEIEMDETMFGGSRDGKRGWGAAGKQVVFGMYKRNGKVLTFPVNSRKKDELKPKITKHSQPGSIYYTDDYSGYSFLSIRGEHVVVEKDKDGKPATAGADHINGIEGFWSFAENWMYQYRGMYKQYFPLYLKEAEFRFNYRDRKLFAFIADLTTN